LPLIDLADRFEVPPKRIRQTLEELKEEHHYLIEEYEAGFGLSQPDPGPDECLILPVARLQDSGWVRFGAVGDSHLGSQWERLDVLEALYTIFEDEGINTVFHGGNIVDGECRFNKHDLKVHGLEGQTQYCIQNYPQRKGIVTRYITADDHEGWWIQREGINYGRYLEQSARQAGREDLVYLSHVEHDVEFKNGRGSSVMRVFHPGGGTAYALSYSVQKIVESYSGGEKPDILLCGHFHKYDHCYPREVHCVQLGTTMDQSRWMRKKKLQAHVGGCIIEFMQGEAGELTRLKAEFIHFYDRGFYQREYEP
jgi:hypothetical protein